MFTLSADDSRGAPGAVCIAREPNNDKAYKHRIEREGALRQVNFYRHFLFQKIKGSYLDCNWEHARQI